MLTEVRSLLRLTPFDTTSEQGRSRERYRRIALTTLASVLNRGVGVAVGLVTVPLVIGYLGKETYGLWAAITAFVAWAALFEFGISNGLVNAISEANGKDDKEAAASYVSTAFLLVTGITAILGAVFLITAPLLAWENVFAVRGAVQPETVRWAVLAAGLCFLLGMPLSIVRQIYAGYQAGYVSNLFATAGSLLTLLGVVLVVGFRGSLPLLILAYGGAGLVVLLVNLVFVLRRQMPWLRLSLSRCTRGALRRIAATSVPLFLFQLGALMVNQSQVLILAHRTNLATVTEYAVLMQLYLLVIGFIAMTTNSFVPTFREAYERGERGWLRRSFRRMLLLRMTLAVIAAGVLIGGGNWLIRTWLQRTDIHYDFVVWLALGMFLLATTWVTAFADLLSILDRIWILVGMVLINGVVTVVLTYTLAPTFGVFGAIVAIAFVTTVVWTWFAPLVTLRVVGLEAPEGPAPRSPQPFAASPSSPTHPQSG